MPYPNKSTKIKNGLNPADLQPLLHVQDRGESRRAAANAIPFCERITSYAAIWIPKASFHTVGSTSGVV